ncbi:MAG: mechanosensitive ion channel family protein [Vicingus serpentipes]|nr:mechanosensitive ion channel family protein [Vicingus serpentipes]
MVENILEYIKFHIFGNSYSRMIVAAIIVVVTIFVRMLIVKLFNAYINKSSAEVKNDPTNYKFLKHAISAIIYIVGLSIAIYSIPSLRSLANSMLAGAGILAVAIGFASQQAFSNIISGVFIIIFKPFRVNDRLKMRDDIYGIVEDITLRHTIIRNYENKRFVIPNAIISEETLINSDIIEEKTCKILDLGIAYSANIDKARSIIQEEAMNHPLYIDNRDALQIKEGEDAVVVRVTAWGDFSINLRVWVWSSNSQSAYTMGCDLRESIKNRFDKENIEIPFPYRTIVYKNDLDKENK